MNTLRRAVRTSTTLATLAVATALVPSSAQAQADEVELDRERVTQYARAHIGLNEARDEFHGKVGRVHDEEGRRRAREELEAAVAEVLSEQEMTQEEYDEITLIISLDGEIRTMFEEILEALAEEGIGTG